MQKAYNKTGQIQLPELSLVVLMGISGSGKSSFAARHFLPQEIVSSDACRAIVSNDENNQHASHDAFELAQFIVSKRLRNGLLTVIDATNTQEEARKDWVQLARQFHVLPIAIVLNLPEIVCAERNRLRADRNLKKHVLPQQSSQLKRSLRRLKLEGFRQIVELRSTEEVAAVQDIIRTPLYNNKSLVQGPFDIIGDVHGCYDELCELLTELGYQLDKANHRCTAAPVGDDGRQRQVVFLGDLVDRGPDTPSVLKLVMQMVKTGMAWCVPGNHDAKLLKWLKGKDVQLKHGLQQSVEQLLLEPVHFREEIKAFIDGLIGHYVFDGGRLVVAHAGLKAEMQGRGSGAVREFCLYGETTGETDEFGLPVRYNWAAEYKGSALVVYGHTPVPEPQWLNRTIDIDTGCVFGGKLTALRYPEKELVSVTARQVYCEPAKPLHHTTTSLTLQQQEDEVLDIADFTGKRIIETAFHHTVTIREENSIAALEVMSRFAINPKWLLYLPPTMSPSETSRLDDYLEHPAEAFGYFEGVGVEKVVCEEKHMGSRAIVVVGRDEEAVRRTFGISNEGSGVIYTRTGRPYFNDKETEQALLQRLNKALFHSGFYDLFKTDWVCLDCELMPWSAKAQSLIETQYASTGAAAMHALTASLETLQQTALWNGEAQPLINRYQERLQQTNGYIKAYQRYCWSVNRLEDYKLAPFHIMATEGKAWMDKDHEWHMNQIEAVCEADPEILLATPYKVVHISDAEAKQEAIDWWLERTGRGGEGMVVKPFNFVHTGKRGLIQPAIKVRGKEYLRIIYGPEYDSPENLARLKSRGLSAKRALALREFALGMEGLQRFVSGEPLRRVHECAFGVLALESEPVDPRL
ncbi:MAG: polynucleotide kinase-phosphatase [Williamsia sp.]|nr:polynucleotide kinase-phosphatase [Williamsia sp.]